MGFTGECWNDSYECESDVYDLFIYLYESIKISLNKKVFYQFFMKKKQNIQFDLLFINRSGLLFLCLNMLISRDGLKIEGSLH